LNKRDPEATKYFYYQIPEHYVWNASKEEWQTRKQSFNTIGRLHQCTPSDGDRFYLRILLCHVKGATSFKDLLTYENITYKTYKEVCLAMGFIKDDAEWIRCLEEAELIMSAAAMRITFARVLAHCHPSEPHKLWERFKTSLSEDFARDTTRNAERLAYIEIVKALQDEGSDISNFPTMQQINVDAEEEEIDCAFEAQMASDKFFALNAEQKKIVIDVLTKLNIEFEHGNYILYLNFLLFRYYGRT